MSTPPKAFIAETWHPLTGPTWELITFDRQEAVEFIRSYRACVPGSFAKIVELAIDHVRFCGDLGPAWRTALN